MTKYLLSITIEGKEKVWNRSLLSSYVPELNDLYYYYNNLCGLNADEILLHSEIVPEGFNDTLLTIITTQPTQFPVNDLETDVGNTEKREQYQNFIKQVCDMERTRESLNVFAKPVIQETNEKIYANTSSHLEQKRAWVRELLASLSSEQDYMEYSRSDELVLRPEHASIPILGWILTPVVDDIRYQKGSRILLDNELGKKWEALLGTDLYPDLIVCRRITTAFWKFRHTTSDTLLQSMLDWYLTMQAVTIENGITDWMENAEGDLKQLIASIKSIKVNPKIENMGADGRTQVETIAYIIEKRFLGSVFDDSTIHPITADLYLRYMNYVYVSLKIPSEQYWNLESLRQTYARWESEKLGFLPDKAPYIEAWADIWKMVMLGDPQLERVAFFLKTLDSWDAIQSILITIPEKHTIVREWVNLYIKNETLPDHTASIQSGIVHDRVYNWCIRFIPKNVFHLQLIPEVIGPVFTENGYPNAKRKGGRWLKGFVFKNL